MTNLFKKLALSFSIVGLVFSTQACSDRVDTSSGSASNTPTSTTPSYTKIGNLKLAGCETGSVDIVRNVNGQIQLTATTTTKNANPTVVGTDGSVKASEIEWSSNEQNIATVDKGLIKGVKAGDTTITAKIGSVSTTCNVKVTAILENIQLDLESLTLADSGENNSKTITASPIPADATIPSEGFQWDMTANEFVNMSNTAGNAQATFIGKKEGSATASVKVGEKSKTLQIKVTHNYIKIGDLTLDCPTQDIVRNVSGKDSFTITASTTTTTADLANGSGNIPNTSITWTSKNTDIATVDKGLVKGVKAGNATITAEADDITKECIVNITAVMQSIKLDKDAVQITDSGTEQSTTVTASIQPDDATQPTGGIKWSIDKGDTNTFASIADNGNGSVTITGKSKGETFATATATTNGINFTSNVSITVNKEGESTIADEISGGGLVANTFFIGAKKTYIYLPAEYGDAGLKIDITKDTDAMGLLGNNVSYTEAITLNIPGSTLAKLDDFSFTAIPANTTGDREFLYKRPNSVWKKSILPKNLDHTAAENHNFSPRTGHKTVVFKGELYLIGGRTDPHYNDGALNDIYKTSSDLKWEKVTTQGDVFSPRFFHGAVVTGTGDNETLWVIGGYAEDSNSNLVRNNEVWKTTDGIHWTQVTQTAGKELPKISSTQVVSFNNKLYVIAGSNLNSTTSNAVFESIDGTEWFNIADSSDIFPARTVHKALVFNNKLWVIGGASDTSVRNTLNDVWSSEDGKTWTQHVADSAEFSLPPRYAQQVISFKNRMWFIGGIDENRNSYNDIYSSVDGRKWVKELEYGAFSARGRNDIVEFHNMLWFSAGHDKNGVYNDIWLSTNAEDWYRGFNFEDVFKK